MHNAGTRQLWSHKTGWAWSVHAMSPIGCRQAPEQRDCSALCPFCNCKRMICRIVSRGCHARWPHCKPAFDLHGLWCAGRHGSNPSEAADLHVLCLGLVMQASMLLLTQCMFWHCSISQTSHARMCKFARDDERQMHVPYTGVSWTSPVGAEPLFVSSSSMHSHHDYRLTPACTWSTPFLHHALCLMHSLRQAAT